MIIRALFLNGTFFIYVEMCRLLNASTHELYRGPIDAKITMVLTQIKRGTIFFSTKLPRTQNVAWALSDTLIYNLKNNKYNFYGHTRVQQCDTRPLVAKFNLICKPMVPYFIQFSLSFSISRIALENTKKWLVKWVKLLNNVQFGLKIRNQLKLRLGGSRISMMRGLIYEYVIDKVLQIYHNCITFIILTD